jgi:hypothetical protein
VIKSGRDVVHYVRTAGGDLVQDPPEGEPEQGVQAEMANAMLYRCLSNSRSKNGVLNAPVPTPYRG